MSKLIVANWKLHPLSVKDAVRLAKASDKKSVVVCPPYPFLPAVQKALQRAALGAQDMFWEEKGPHTGEVSAAMLKAFKTRYVIIGHSERRALGETDEAVNKKVRAVLRSGLTAILCVGEPKAVRRKGLAAAKQYVARQLKQDLAGVGESVIIAYEPIWAIGTGVPDKPEESAAMAKFIKATVKGKKVKVLYGGSVKPENAKKFLSQKDIDGALVGGASLDAGGFKKVIAAGE